MKKTLSFKSCIIVFYLLVFITFILGASFIFEVAKLLSLRGYFDITDFFYYMAGAALAYYIYRSIKFFTKK